MHCRKIINYYPVSILFIIQYFNFVLFVDVMYSELCMKAQRVQFERSNKYCYKHEKKKTAYNRCTNPIR